MLHGATILPSEDVARALVLQTAHKTFSIRRKGDSGRLFIVTIAGPIVLEYSVVRFASQILHEYSFLPFRDVAIIGKECIDNW